MMHDESYGAELAERDYSNAIDITVMPGLGFRV